MARPAAPGVRDALLDAARAEFAHRGLDRARVEDICRRARISKGAFYLHFRTKDDAFHEIVQRYFGALEDHAVRACEVEEQLAREGAAWDGPDGFGRFLEAECALDAGLLDVMWRNRQITAAVVSSRRPPYRALVSEFRTRMQGVVALRIADRQRAGMVRRDVDARAVADVVVGAYEDLARRMIDFRQRPDLSAWSRSFLVLLYEGILPRPAARAADRRTAG